MTQVTQTIVPVPLGVVASFRRTWAELVDLWSRYPEAVARRRFEYDRPDFGWPEVVVACLHVTTPWGPRVFPLQTTDVMAKCRMCVDGNPDTEVCNTCWGTGFAPLHFHQHDFNGAVFLDGQTPQNAHGLNAGRWRILPVEETDAKP